MKNIKSNFGKITLASVVILATVSLAFLASNRLAFGQPLPLGQTTGSTIKRATAATWVSQASVLNDGELGYETDTKIIRIGDGYHRFAELAGIPITAILSTGITDSTTNGRALLTATNAAAQLSAIGAAPASGSTNYAPITGSTNYQAAGSYAPSTGSTNYQSAGSYAPASGSTNYIGVTATNITPLTNSTPATIGQMVFEATANNTITVKYMGSDGTNRAGIILLTP